MRFLWAKFDNILELNGEMEFSTDKVVILYGANLQGKTNIINSIRFTFLSPKKGKKKIEYDDWALPTREEVAPDGGAKIDVVFEHGGGYYSLHREISAGGKRDEPVLSELSGWPGKKIRTVDFRPFVKERLKAGLLDALFAIRKSSMKFLRRKGSYLQASFIGNIANLFLSQLLIGLIATI